MTTPAQGVAAAAMAATAALGISAPYSFDQNGVQVGINQANPITYPAVPDSDHPEYLWPTAVLYYNLSMPMQDGSVWKVSRPPLLYPDGSIQVQVARKMPTYSMMLTVQAADVNTPIWNMGIPQPTPGPVEAPIEVENPVPVPPQTPGDGSESPPPQ